MKTCDMSLQEKYDALKTYTPTRLNRLLPPGCKGNKMNLTRNVFKPNQPPHFIKLTTPLVIDCHAEKLERLHKHNETDVRTVSEYIAAWDKAAGLKHVEYELVTSPLAIQHQSAA